MHLATGVPFTRTLDIDYRFSVRLRVNPAVQQAQGTVEVFLVVRSLVCFHTISPSSQRNMVNDVFRRRLRCRQSFFGYSDSDRQLFK